MKKTIFIFAISLLAVSLTACHSKPKPLTGDGLRLALHHKIDNHTVVGYRNLWDHFANTDPLPNQPNTVWDIYSYQTTQLPYRFTFNKDQCGNYKKEGDCYNREHSFPQSWWGGGSDPEPPMKSDLYHIYPTDGKVNSIRANYPYGIVDSTAKTITTQDGSKLGHSALSCYSGKVFEPIDEFKGDLARGYFYLLTRYMPHIASWNSPVLQDNNLNPCFKALLVKWHQSDPVSEKEILRNRAIQKIQNNYNPFIVDPTLVEQIWGQ